MESRSTIRQWLQRNIKRILPHYIHHRNYINFGNGEVTTIRHIIYIVIGMKIAFITVGTPWLVLFGCLYVMTTWLIGWVYDKNDGYDLQAEWGNRRNPTLQHIKQKV